MTDTQYSPANDPRDALVLALAERLYICSRLLTCAAERLGWDSATVAELLGRIDNQVQEGLRDAKVQH